MKKLKVMIIEEQQTMIDCLQTAVDWNTYSFEITTIANTVERAIAFCIEYQHDLIFCSTLVPDYNIHSFQEKLRKFCPNTKFVLISSDESYASVRTAFLTGALDYLSRVKFQANDIQNILNKFSNSDNESLNEEKENNKREIKQFLGNIIDNQPISNEKINSIINLPQFKYLNSPYRLLYIRMDNVRLYTKGLPKFRNRNEHEFEKLYFDAIVTKKDLGITIQNITSSFFNFLYKKSIFSIKDHSILVILEDTNITLDTLKKLQQELNDKTNQQFSIVLSKLIYGKDNFIYAFQSILNYHNHKFYIGDNAILFEDDNFVFNTLKIDEISYHNQIFTLFKNNKFDQIQIIFENLLDYMKLHYIDKQNIMKYLQIFFLHLNNSFLKKSSDINYLINEIIYNLSLSESIDTLHIQLLNVIHTFYELFNSQQLSKNQYYIKLVDCYIKQHMNEKISLKKLSYYVNFSSVHLSRIVKSETKLTLIPYITKKKLEMAQKLLMNQKLKIKDVAKMVGYEDPLYFNKVFKKEFNQTPKEYRKRV